MSTSVPRPAPHRFGSEPDRAAGGDTAGRGDLLRRAATTALRLIIVGVAVLAVVLLLRRLALVAIPFLAAVLLAALLQPLSHRLRRWRVPAALAALLPLLLALVVVLGPLAFAAYRAVGQIPQLAGNLQTGLNQARDVLVSGPLELQADQVDALVVQAQDRLAAVAGTPLSTVTSLLSLLAGLVLMLFVLFFLLYDGQRVWRWVVQLWPARLRPTVDEAGREAWRTLSRYVVGVIVVALADGLFIGLGLELLGVPLALSLAALTFLGAFVPLLGATVTGLLAVVIAFVSQGLTGAALVLLLVVAVQQLEGNLLQPLIMRRAVELHPLATLLTVASGGVLFGIFGAVLAVPTVAVSRAALHRVIRDRVPAGAA